MPPSEGEGFVYDMEAEVAEVLPRNSFVNDHCIFERLNLHGRILEVNVVCNYLL